MSELRLKIPGFAYPGGKVRLRKWLVSYMPLRGRTYLEPFAGRGNVFWYASQFLGFERWWLNDPWTARWFEVIRDFDLSKIPLRISREEGLRLSHRASTHRDRDDLAVLLESKCQFCGGAAFKKGSAAATIKRFNRNLFVKEILRARSILAESDAKITDASFEDLAYDDLCERDFVYLDPPYVGNDAGYMLNNVDHEALLKMLVSSEFLWMLSGYSSQLYLDMLGPPEHKKTLWLNMDTTDKTHRTKIRTECIWTNYVIGQDGIARRRKVIRASKR